MHVVECHAFSGIQSAAVDTSGFSAILVCGVLGASNSKCCCCGEGGTGHADLFQDARRLPAEAAARPRGSLSPLLSFYHALSGCHFTTPESTMPVSAHFLFYEDVAVWYHSIALYDVGMAVS